MPENAGAISEGVGDYGGHLGLAMTADPADARRVGEAAVVRPPFLGGRPSARLAADGQRPVALAARGVPARGREERPDGDGVPADSETSFPVQQLVRRRIGRDVVLDRGGRDRARSEPSPTATATTSTRSDTNSTAPAAATLLLQDAYVDTVINDPNPQDGGSFKLAAPRPHARDADGRHPERRDRPARRRAGGDPGRAPWPATATLRTAPARQHRERYRIDTTGRHDADNIARPGRAARRSSTTAPTSSRPVPTPPTASSASWFRHHIHTTAGREAERGRPVSQRVLYRRRPPSADFVVVCLHVTRSRAIEIVADQAAGGSRDDPRRACAPAATPWTSV